MRSGSIITTGSIKIRVAWVSFSFGKTGKAYRSRNALKLLLPGRFGKLVNEIGKHNHDRLDQDSSRMGIFQFRQDRQGLSQPQCAKTTAAGPVRETGQ